MPEYVKRECVLAKAVTWPGACCKLISSWDVIHIKAEDVMPVVHGYWIGGKMNPLSGEYHSECSVCHKLRTPDNYCPNCGAKMDEIGGNNETD